MANTFNLHQSKNVQNSLKYEKYHSAKYLISLLAVIALISSVLSVVLQAGSPLIGLYDLVAAIATLVALILGFNISYYRPKTVIASDNVADALLPEAIQVIVDAEAIAIEGKFSQVEPIIMLAAIEKNQAGKYLLMRLDFGLEEDLSGMISSAILEVPRNENIKELAYPEDSLEVLTAAKANAQLNNRDQISIGDIFVGLIQKSDVFKKIMYEIKIEEDDVKHVVEWYELLKEHTDKLNVPFWEKPMGGGVGRDWSFGYTRILSQFARNLNDEIEFSGDVHVYGRSREVDEIERILAKTGQNNALLIGEPGIGKKTIVKGFVSKIVRGEVLPALKYQQVFQVDTGAILSGSGDSSEIAGRVKGLFNEAASAGNIILFFDNFQDLVSHEQGVGRVNTSEIILPYLQGGVRIIGATDIKQYHKDIESNPGVAAVFDRIEVKEPSGDETLKVLEEMIPFIEYRDGVFWPYQSVKEVVRVATKYIQNKPFPQKAIEIVDEASVQVAKGGSKIISIKSIDDMISKKLEVPVTAAEGEEAKKLMNLEEFLHMRVIGQDEAIEAVSSAMRRARAGLQSKQRPIGNFLFLGPTGVGKTETAKALAEAYFGSDKSMIRLDMSEFQEKDSVSRMIGSPPGAGGEGEKGQLTTAVADNPFCLILLDEIEKSHPDILTLFLQVFDDGRLTDGTGRTVDFTNTIIIATSNAGSELIRESIMKGIAGEALKKNLLEFLQAKGQFKPEFLNRFDAVVAFHPLTEEQIVKVAQLMLKSLSDRMGEKDIDLEFTPAAVAKLAKAGFDPVYGARPMRRAIQDKVENALANSILTGAIARGAKVTIDEKDIA